MHIHIITDSASDITQDEANAWGVEVLPLKVFFGEEEFLDGVTMGHRVFFERLVESDTLPTTSQLTPYEYAQKFQEIVDAGDAAICITLSSKLSGCFQSAVMAASDFSDRILVVDSENVCIGQRILVQRAMELRDKSCSAQEIADTLETEKKNIRLIALLDTLEYLKKGGRVSPAVAFAGSLLNIKPVIAVEDGAIAVLGKARGSRNGNNMLMDLVKKEGGIHFDRPFCLAYSGLSDALLQKYISDSAALYEGKTDSLPISFIGCAIGTHAGPGAIAAAFFTGSC